MRRLVIFIALYALFTVAYANAGKLKRKRDCNTGCGRINQPVCGSDGTTYANKCELRNAKCRDSKLGKKLLLQYEGACRKPSQVDTVAVSKSKRRKNIKKKKKRKPCPASFSRCKLLNSTRNAVCGSDNNTYHTFCHLRIAKCHASVAGKSLTVLYKGVCGKPKRQLVCPVASQCPNRNSPICGNNGVTYKNLCYFLIAKCEARKQKRRFKMRYRGTCGVPATPKSCPKSCPTIRKQVCGSDGKTYDNGCWLAKAKCLLPKGQKRQLRVQYRGACGVPSTPKPCLTIRKCRHKRGSPVCGTDGISYPSKCHLRVVKCQAKRKKRSPILLKHMGRCIEKNSGVGR